MLAVWVEAGQPAETFWDQTPRTHAYILKGCGRLEIRRQEQAMTIGWHAENFRRMGKKMRGLDHHLKALKPRPIQTPEQVVAIFEGFAARGLATIRQVKKGGADGE